MNNEPDVLTPEATHLGKKSEYKFDYDPSLLVAIPRQENRTLIDIKDSDLPFVGFDVWNAYEVSCLADNGLPVVGIAKIVYDSSSKFLVESKSLKLYLNSFNMTTVQGTSVRKVLDDLTLTISNDLSKLLQTPVRVHMFTANEYVLGTRPYAPFALGGLSVTNLDGIWLDEIIVDKNISFKYTESPDLLVVNEPARSGCTLQPELIVFESALLRSNCKITKQPDWGNVYIGMRSQKKIEPVSLLQYIVSFRNENHFHEEICETIYKRLLDKVQPFELIVACYYTRRGGIDICPVRASHQYLLTKYMSYDSTPHYFSYKHERR